MKFINTVSLTITVLSTLHVYPQTDKAVATTEGVNNAVRHDISQPLSSLNTVLTQKTSETLPVIKLSKKNGASIILNKLILAANLPQGLLKVLMDWV